MQREELVNGSLIIDGAYLSIGIKILKEKGTLSSNFKLTDKVVSQLLDELSRRSKTKLIDQHFISAEHPKYHEKNQQLYRSLERNGVKKEMHEFKSRRSKCPQCKYTFSDTIQAEVDVAIATKMFRAMLKTKDKIGNVILVAGDRDFKSALEFIVDRFEANIWVVGFKGNMSPYLKEVIQREHYIYLDDVLKDIDRPENINQGHHQPLARPAKIPMEDIRVQPEIRVPTYPAPEVIPIPRLREEHVLLGGEGAQRNMNIGVPFFPPPRAGNNLGGGVPLVDHQGGNNHNYNHNPQTHAPHPTPHIPINPPQNIQIPNPHMYTPPLHVNNPPEHIIPPWGAPPAAPNDGTSQYPIMIPHDNIGHGEFEGRKEQKESGIPEEIGTGKLSKNQRKKQRKKKVPDNIADPRMEEAKVEVAPKRREPRVPTEEEIQNVLGQLTAMGYTEERIRNAIRKSKCFNIGQLLDIIDQ